MPGPNFPTILCSSTKKEEHGMETQWIKPHTAIRGPDMLFC